MRRRIISFIQEGAVATLRSLSEEKPRSTVVAEAGGRIVSSFITGLIPGFMLGLVQGPTRRAMHGTMRQATQVPMQEAMQQATWRPTQQPTPGRGRLNLPSRNWSPYLYSTLSATLILALALACFPASSMAVAPSFDDMERFEGGYLLPVGGGVLLSLAERYEKRAKVGSAVVDEARLVLTVRTKRRFGCSNYAIRLDSHVEGSTISISLDRVEAYLICVPPIGQALSTINLDLESGDYDLFVKSEGGRDSYRLSVGDEEISLVAREISFSSIRPVRADSSELRRILTLKRAFARIIVAHCGRGSSVERMPELRSECDRLFEELAKFAQPLEVEESMEADPSWRRWWMKATMHAADKETRVYRLRPPESKDPGARRAYYRAKMEQLKDIVEPLIHGVAEDHNEAASGGASARGDYSIRVVTWLGDEFCC